MYGSLRQGFNSPAYEYIYKYFNLVGTAKTKGLMYDLGQYPAAIPTDEEKYVVGELYEIKHPDQLQWALVQLDDYEGVIVEADETQEYYRAITEVHCNNALIPANVYWYNLPVTNCPLVESGDVFQYIKSKHS